MRLFIYEHICASGTLSPLRNEGWAMLSAVVEDCQQLPEFEICTLLDRLCAEPLGKECRRLAAPAKEIPKAAAPSSPLSPGTPGERGGGEGADACRGSETSPGV